MFTYDINQNYCPLTPSEAQLPTVTAEKFLLVTKEKPKHVEGICFDRHNNMYFVSTYDGKALRYSFDTGETECVWQDPDLKPVSVKIHKDGRLFISCLGTAAKSGRIVVTDPDGKEERVLAEGHEIDDVVFDREGGFYYTLFDGTPYQPTGSIQYVTPDLKEDTCFIPNLAGPNGVCLSTDEKVMWVTEFLGGRLLRIPMDTPYGSVVYHFTGYYGPDSCSVDEDDNVYVAHYGQGQVLVFDPLGNPIGQILMPNRHLGHLLCSSHPMVRPDTKELYITAADDIGDEGSWIMRAPAPGKGHKGAYQFQR